VSCGPNVYPPTFIARHHVDISDNINTVVIFLHHISLIGPGLVLVVAEALSLLITIVNSFMIRLSTHPTTSLYAFVDGFILRTQVLPLGLLLFGLSP